MDIVIQISVAVIAIAFLVLLYSLVKTLKTVRGTLEETRQTIGQLRTEVSQISVDVKQAIHNTNAMTQDVRTKLSSLNVLFASVNDIGHAIQSFTGVARESAASIASTIKRESSIPVKEPSSKLSSIYNTILSTAVFWNKIKKV